MRDKTWTWSAAAGSLAFEWGVKVSSSIGNSFDLPVSHKLTISLPVSYQLLRVKLGMRFHVSEAEEWATGI